MLNRFNKKSQKAIGLLELMLSLAIIAVLLIMATRYYSSASSSQKIQAAVDQINAVRSAVQNAAGGSSSGAGNITASMLVESGYLPSSFIAPSLASSSTAATGYLTPWGQIEGLTLSTGTGKTFSISMTTPGDDICNAVVQKLVATAQSTSATCSNGSTVTATYYY